MQHIQFRYSKHYSNRNVLLSNLYSQPEKAEEQISRTAELGQLLAVLRIIFGLSGWKLILLSIILTSKFYAIHHLYNYFTRHILKEGFPVNDLHKLDKKIGAILNWYNKNMHIS